ncbi:MAG: aldo/keto reductase [Acholeplasmataceae bacterium]|jgi:aryl-alcohol dehydrogenase-like predicted oxidoreductase|nr:aldo/keto reductase [Acholeplasmataceae bacterium]
MKYRTFGKTGYHISEISLGTWQLGNTWGLPFSEITAIDTLQTATSLGINAFDTADVYVGGLSEKTIGVFNKARKDKAFVITKMGRRLNPHVKEGYNEENLRRFVDESRRNLQVDQLDMILLHCPPTEVYYEPTVFKVLDTLKKEGKIKHYGVSVEKIEEGLKAMNYPGVEAIEIIFNMFRLRPMELFFEEAKKKNVGIIVRVPLASGLLTGKYDEKTTFNPNDHRTFNREGQSFDKGETFSGVNYQQGLSAVSRLKEVFKTDDLAPIALRFCLMFDAVSTVIPGASRPEQVRQNVLASELKPLTDDEMKKVFDIYETYIKDPVHDLW